MKKLKLLLLLLLPFLAIGQVSTGAEQQFDYGIQNNAAQTISTPINIVTQGADGTQGKAVYSTLPLTGTAATALGNKADKTNGATQITDPNAHTVLATSANATQSVINTAIDTKVGANTTSISLKEDSANKQNSMAIGGFGTKFPTVDAVNAMANDIAKAALNVGMIDVINDAFTMARADDTHLNVTGSTKGIIFPYLYNTPPFAPSDAVRQIPTISNYALQNFLTYLPTSTTQGVFYIGFRNSTQTIELASTSFVQNPNVFQMGIIYLKNVAGTISFIDINRTVIVIPDVAQYSNLETTAIGIKSSVVMSPNSGMTVKNSAGSMVGISVCYKCTNNDEKAIAISNPTSFIRLNPGNANSTTLPAFSTTFVCNDYWNGTAMVSLGANANSSVQRWLLTVRGTIILQAGEAQYNNLSDGNDATSYASFTDFLPKGTFVEIGRVVAVRNASDLTNNTQAIFSTTNSGGGGSGSSSTVQFAGIQGQPTDNTNLATALNAKVSGNGTVNKIPKWSTTTSQGDSNISDDGTTISLIGTSSFTKTGTISSTNGASVNIGGTLTASTGAARTISSAYIAPTLIAGNNNDTMIGLDVNPTFTNGAFTGVVNTPLRVQSSSASNTIALFKNQLNTAISAISISDDTNSKFIDVGVSNSSSAQGVTYGLPGESFVRASSSSLGLHLIAASLAPIKLSINSIERIRLFAGTGNLVLQNGGTFTDNGTDRLQITGSAISSGWKTSGGIATQCTMADGSLKSVGAITKTRKDITGTTYTVISSDVDKILYTTNSSPVTITVPSGLTINQVYEFFRLGSGSVTFVASSTTLVKSSYELLNIAEQYGRVMIKYFDTESYQLYGGLGAY